MCVTELCCRNGGTRSRAAQLGDALMELIMGCPRTLNDVFASTGAPHRVQT